MFKTIAKIGFATFILLAAPAYAADINREWVDFTPPAEIKWVKNPNGSNESAVLFGDPSKPGPYVIRLKWNPGIILPGIIRKHFCAKSRPSSRPNVIPA